MSANKYGNALTIILVVIIVAILIGVGIWVYSSIVKPRVDENKNIEAIAEFDRNVEFNQDEDEEEAEEEGESGNTTIEIQPTEPTQNPNNPKKKKTYYEGYVMIGYITIPKTNVKIPILDTVTPESLNTAVAALYPSNPQLNQPGNVVIVGHNYKNGQFFSNNKNLELGDKIKIKDVTGTELTYTIYEKFETTPEDTSFYTRNTNGAIEITLSTCTDDVSARTIIQARVE